MFYYFYHRFYITMLRCLDIKAINDPEIYSSIAIAGSLFLLDTAFYVFLYHLFSFEFTEFDQQKNYTAAISAGNRIQSFYQPAYSAQAHESYQL